MSVNGTRSHYPQLRALRYVQVLGRINPAMTSRLLMQTRKSRGLSLDIVAKVVGTDPTNLSRVEKGEQTPKRDLARALYDYYKGTVPLGAIYDPEYYDSRNCRG